AGAEGRRLLRAAVEPRHAGGRGARGRARHHRARRRRRAGHARRVVAALPGQGSRGNLRGSRRRWRAMRPAWTVCRKELVDNARDRRTLFSAFIFGPLFGPVLFAVLVNVVVSQAVSSIDEPFSIPIVAAEQAPNLIEYLNARGVQASSDHGITGFKDATAAVESGAYEVILLVEDNFAERFATEGAGRVGLIYDQSNSRANSRIQRVRGAVAGYSQQIGALKLLARGIQPDVLTAVTLDEFDVSTAAGRSVVLLGMLTYFLLLATLM